MIWLFFLLTTIYARKAPETLLSLGPHAHFFTLTSSEHKDTNLTIEVVFHTDLMNTWNLRPEVTLINFYDYSEGQPVPTSNTTEYIDALKYCE